MKTPFRVVVSLAAVTGTVACLAGFFYPFRSPPAADAAWISELARETRSIDEASSGNLGVYVKRLGSNEEMLHEAERAWYFASTVKVPVAIALLQKVEEGKLSLNQKVVVNPSAHVDGSGEVRLKRPGSKVSVAYLLDRMLTQSDSTATDLLIGLIGVEELNERIRSKMGVGDFKPFTTILQVRYDAFGYFHPKVQSLSNLDFIALKNSQSSAAKLNTLAKRMKVPRKQLKPGTVDEAFEKYYATGFNSGSLKSFGLLLERLYKGELLSKRHTDLVLKHMEEMSTGERRIKAGLWKGVRFAQKTGTQVNRICNVGIIRDVVRDAKTEDTFVVTACVEKFKSFSGAEQTLAQVGEAITRTLGPSKRLTAL